MGTFLMQMDRIVERSEFKCKRYLSKELAMDLLRSVSAPILFYSKTDGWTGANRAFFELFQFEDMDDFLRYHSSIQELVYTQSEERFKKDDRHWLEYVKEYANGTHKVAFEIDGEIRTYTLGVSHSFYFDDLLIVELNEITALQHATKRIEEIERLKSAFLSRIGQELRTPLNGVLGFSELLTQTNLDELQQNYLNMLKRSSESLLFNVEALLSLSRLQSGEMTLNTSYVDMLEYLENVATHFTIAAYENRSRLYTFIDPKLPLEVLSDVKKIEQIVWAFLQHSMEYTSKGEWILLDVKAVEKKENECAICFGVRHNGRGLTSEEIEAILDPFGSHGSKAFDIGLTLANEYVRLLGSKLSIESDVNKGSHFKFTLRMPCRGKREYKELKSPKIAMFLLDASKQNSFNIVAHYFKSFGFETKLYETLNAKSLEDVEFVYVVASKRDEYEVRQIVKRKKEASLVLIQPLGAKELDIRLKSFFDAVLDEPYLPTRIYRQMVAISQYKGTKRSEETLHLRKQLRALVVEDNAINQKLITILLEKRGFDVSVASDGQEGVDKALLESYDIIFMDIDMPKKDGITATAEIKKYSKVNAKTPIVAFTAKALEGDKEMLLSKGLDDYMSKPIQKEELDTILRYYLDEAIN